MFPKRFHRKLKSLRTRRRPAQVPIAERFSIEAVEARLLLTVTGGFTATYFNNADLTSPVTTDNFPAVNFNWGTTTPAPGVDPNTFSIRFTSFIQPTYSQNYTFYTAADDGVRLYINGQKLIDRWTNQPSLPGDANNDGVVNFTDYQLLEVQFGTSNPQSDFDHNGTVDRADLKTLVDN
jgi:hypothetical protein